MKRYQLLLEQNAAFGMPCLAGLGVTPSQGNFCLPNCLCGCLHKPQSLSLFLFVCRIWKGTSCMSRIELHYVPTAWEQVEQTRALGSEPIHARHRDIAQYMWKGLARQLSLPCRNNAPEKGKENSEGIVWLHLPFVRLEQTVCLDYLQTCPSSSQKAVFLC